MTPRARHRLLCGIGIAMWLSWCALIGYVFGVNWGW